MSTAIKQRRPVSRAFLSGMAASLLEGVSPVARTIVGITWLAAFAAVAAFALRTVTGPGPATGAAYETLYVALYMLPGGLCIARAALVRHERGPWLAFGIGMLAWAGGYAYYFAVLQDLPSPPSPSPSDALWLTYYACAGGALISLLRRRLGSIKKSLWIDVAIAALALASISAALLVDPILASTGGELAAVATNLAYPVADVLLIGVVLAAFALSGWRPGESWYLLGAAFAIQIVFDTVYLYQVASGTYVAGTSLDAVWPALMLMIAAAAWQKPRTIVSTEYERWHALVVSIVFAAVALFLTTYDHFVPLHSAATILAAATLAAAFVRTMTTFADVRSLSKSRELLAQNQSILNSAGEGIYGLDRWGRITFANPATADLTGYGTDELVGLDAHLTLHHAETGESPMVAALREGAAPTAIEGLYRRRDGSTFPVEYTCTALEESGRVAGAVVVFKDVTERREVERLKEEFTSVVSHELRTPLTSIRGSLGLLASGTLGALSPKGQRMADIAVSNTDRLVRLINDILDIERIDSGHVTMERVASRTDELVARAVEVMRPMADEAGVRVETNAAGLRIEADPDRIIQTLTNLISNSIKFSPPESVISVSAERDGRRVLFRITDAGRGIPADKLETVFERFGQVDASDSREKGGTGLGLPICRRIVQQHGGEIWADSVEGEGTTLSFTLPVSEVESPIATEPDERPAGPLVLVCDDDASVVETVSLMLEERGYRVIPATSGQEAVELALEARPDVIVLDLLMPGMSGWEAASALNEHPETAAIPLVVLSVLAADEAEPPGGDVVGWLEKPPNEQSLFQALERAVNRDGHPPRVLVVEDDEDLAGVLLATFEHHGLETHHATDGVQAIELSQRVRPDLLVLDLVLPEMDGFEVVDWLQRHDRLKSVPIMVYTARDLDADDRARLNVDAGTQLFTKSRVSPDQFEERVMDLVNRITRQPKEPSDEAQAHPDRR